MEVGDEGVALSFPFFKLGLFSHSLPCWHKMLLVSDIHVRWTQA